MKNLLITFLLSILCTTAFSQKFVTRTGHLKIKSANNVQNIVADNYQVACRLDANTGKFKIITLIKSFDYQLNAIDRIMNTNNIDVSAYPKITYEGKILNLKDIKFNQVGTYQVKLHGILYIWNEKRPTNAEGKFTINDDGTIHGISNFNIIIEDKTINKIDQIMKQKLPDNIHLNTSTFGISNNIKINAELNLESQ